MTFEDYQADKTPQLTRVRIQEFIYHQKPLVPDL